MPAAEEDILPARVVVTCSLTRGKTPNPGIHPTPFIWRDVVSRPPPRKRSRAGTHVTYHLTEQAPDVRLSFVTHVRVEPGDDIISAHDDVINVEERVYIQRRVLHELIDREKAFSDKLAVRWRSRLGHGLARQRRAVNRVALAWLVTLLSWFIRVEAKVGFAFIRGTRAFLRALVHGPDALLTRTGSAQRHLSDRMGRRHIFRHLTDPSSASNEEKGVLFLLTAGIIVGTVLLLNTLFALVLDAYAPTYRSVLGNAAYNIGNVFIPLPVPPEVLIVLEDERLYSLTLGLFLGKVLGSWLLFLVGDSAHDTLAKQTAKSPRLAKVVEWLKAKANSSGFILLFLLSFIPFLPDTLVLAFAVSGMRFKPFIWGIALGTLAKYAAIVIALFIVGPEVVGGWLDTMVRWLNPFSWF